MSEQAYKRYLIAVLTLIFAFNSVDRLALGLFLQNIKTDLQLSDTQLGLLSGIAFALFYAVMGIPIARWADRGNRVLIIALTTALWCAAVALCGLAESFLQLLVIRVAVAVGEAGCVPPAHSLISTYFTRAERPRAFSRYLLGPQISAIIGYFLAGWLTELFGWRAAFVVLGLPGLALAAVAWFTLREPRTAEIAKQRPTGADEPEAVAEKVTEPSFATVCRTLLANKTFRHLLFCLSITSLFAYGLSKWKPTFFIRSYGLSIGELGTWFALIYGVGGGIGTYLGGELATRYARNDEKRQLVFIAVAYACFAFLSTLIYLSPNYFVAFGVMGCLVVMTQATGAPLYATIQTLVPDRMRATSIAIIYLFSNLVGMGLGPLLAGALSDALQPRFGEESLRFALLALCPGYFLGAWHLWRASKTINDDAKQKDDQGP